VRFGAMMDMNFMLIIDVVILVLGAYLVFAGIKNYKLGDVDNMLITAEERAKCSDIKGLSNYLMPKSAIFGAFCILFGIQGLLSDSQKLEFPKAVNAAFLVAFVIVWVVFSSVIRKAKKTYIH
jgi:uncharacterized membrane protein HdeD (DUF308 family)